MKDQQKQKIYHLTINLHANPTICAHYNDLQIFLQANYQ